MLLNFIISVVPPCCSFIKPQKLPLTKTVRTSLNLEAANNQYFF